MEWNKVSLIGLGLLGGSLGKALITGKHAGRVVGSVRHPERIQQACDAGVVHGRGGLPHRIDPTIQIDQSSGCRQV